MIKSLTIKGQSAYYEAGALSDVTGGEIQSRFVETGCSKLLFGLSGLDTDEYDTLKRNIPGIYAARIQYSAAAGDIVLPHSGTDCGVEPAARENSFIRELYLQKVMEFYQEWIDYVTPDRVDFSRNVAQYKLLAENSLCLEKDSVPVGLTTIYKREETGAYCLNWIWFAPSLSQQERACAHHLTAAWLKEKGYALDAFVDAFNKRSLGFFRKLGFRPVCLHITKNTSR